MSAKTSAGRAVHARRVDVFLAAATAVASFVLLLPYLDASMLSIRASVLHMPDEGTILSNADRVSRGHALYRDAFDFKGPIGYLPYVVAYKLAPATARTGRVTMFAIVALWAAATFEVARRVTRSRLLGIIVALLIPLQVWQSWTYAYQDFTAQLFLVLGVLAALVTIDPARQPERPRPADAPPPSLGFAAAGFFAALALWTSLAQGLSGVVALGFTVAFVVGMTEGRRHAVRAAAAFALGVASATGAVFAWLASMGAVRAGLEAMLVFPFKHYSASNKTPYGYDAHIYADRWMQPTWVHEAASVMMRATSLVPPAALVAAASIALCAGLLAVRPSARLRLGTTWVRAVVPVSLAATAVPVVLNATRSDVCHLGFIEGGCFLALITVFAVRPGGGVGRRVGALIRGAVALALTVVLVAAGAFYVHTLRVKPDGFSDIDVVGRRDYVADLIAARTDPQDRLLVTSYGGWYYLYSRRDNATSFAFLMDDPYCVEQWPVAARQVVNRRPLLLLVPQSHFERLRSHEPQIGSMYFGDPGNYMLDDRGAGPVFATPAELELVVDGAGGGPPDRLHVTLQARATDHAGAQLSATSPGRASDARAAIHRDLLSIFFADRTYVGRVSADGSRLVGTQFGPGIERHPFVGSRIRP